MERTDWTGIILAPGYSDSHGCVEELKRFNAMIDAGRLGTEAPVRVRHYWELVKP